MGRHFDFRKDVHALYYIVLIFILALNLNDLSRNFSISLSHVFQYHLQPIYVSLHKSSCIPASNLQAAA